MTMIILLFDVLFALCSDNFCQNAQGNLKSHQSAFMNAGSLRSACVLGP